MGTLVGHVAPGFGFLFIGLWHLYNNIKLHSIHPDSYVSLPWFPSPRLRYLELILIMAGSCASIAMELFIGPANHQPLDPSDWTIPTDHLHNFEHASISLTFFLYAAFAAALDRLRPPAHRGLTFLLAAAAFSQQLLMFHLHSADHMGVEGQYHWLLQLVVAVSLTTTLACAALPGSFLVGFVRSASIAFQGVWFIVMGYVLWTPALVFKGCFMNLEDGHDVVRCHGDAALHRAKSLVNIQFSWVMAGMIVFSMVLYLYLTKVFPEEPEYVSVAARADSGDGFNDDDLESQKKKLEECQSFLHIGKGMKAMGFER